MKRSRLDGFRLLPHLCGLIALLGCLTTSAATEPTFEWVKTQFTSDWESGGGVAVDKLGRVLWGRLRAESGYHLVLLKYNPDGSLISTKTSYSTAGSYLPSVSLAWNDDDGLMFLTADGGGNGGALGRYSSSGTRAWGSTNTSSNYTVSWNSVNGLYRACSAAGPGGTNVFAFPYNTFTLPTQSLRSDSDTELAVVKMAPTGAAVWIKKVIGAGLSIPTGVVLDSDGNIYVSGFNSGTVAFDAITLPGRGGPDGFIVKYDRDGNVVWVRGQNCTADDRITTMTMGMDGKLWTTGTNAGTITFDGFILAGSGNYLASWRLDGTCASAAWLPSNITVTQMQPAPDGTLILSGVIRGTTLGSLTVPNQGGDDIYVASISTAGTPIWAKTMGYVYADVPGGLAVASSGEIYVSGTVRGGAVFDSQFIGGYGNEDAFLAKLAPPAIPQLTEWPQSTNAFRGAPVTLTCAVAPGPAVTYRWFFNDVPIPLATNASITLPSVTTANQGYYYVEVTNEAGTVRSPVAQLTLRGQLPIIVTTVAGTNVSGYVDANRGADVRFNHPNGLAHWSGGLTVVADGWNHAIRLFDPSGAVVTYAGRNLAGNSNGPATLALFNRALGLTVEPSLDVLVADTSNNVIRRISPFGLRNVTTVAGSGERGYLDGPGTQAQFDYPNDLAVDTHGNIYVTEWQNHTVRKITPEGVVSTFAGDGVAGSGDGVGAGARFNQPAGIAIDPAGNLYVTEWTGHRVRRISPARQVTTLAGTNSSGFVDGQGRAARFYQPDGITMDDLGNLYVTDAGNHAIRKIDPQGLVTTVAGLGITGLKDGDANTALFNLPGGITWHPSGALYVSDTMNHAIRRIEFRTDTSYPEAAALLITVNPTLTLFGKPGNTYRIEAAEARTLPLDWTVLDTITLTNGVGAWCDPQPATRIQRLYRAVKVN